MAINNKGIIYYKLDSDFHYEGDYTKNCGLSGGEIDGNFNFLRGQDISSFDFDEKNGSLIIKRLNNETLSIDLKSKFNDFEFEYDSEKGILKVVMPYGKTFDLEGFFTKHDIKVYTDDTINGDGSKNNPLTVSNTIRTGTYRPAKSVYDTTREKLPTSGVSKYDRYVTKERVSKFGLLYPLNGIKAIEAHLKDIDSEWRVPTKEDWDILLNIAETYPEDANHNSTLLDVYLGMDAGAALKSIDEWIPYYVKLEDGEIVVAGRRYNLSEDGEYIFDENGEYIKIYMSNNKYGFAILPVGYGKDGVDDISGYGKCAAYWTNSESENGIFVKEFSFDRRDVKQIACNENAYLSLRLVKDYNGNNYNTVENIDGNLVVTQMFSNDSNDKALIWTNENIYLANEEFGGVVSEEWNTNIYSEYRYFINEWDGTQWVRNTMEEGESIVIFNYNNIDMHEWRIINGKLTDASVTFEGAISDAFTAFSKELDDLEADLGDETRNRKQADNEIRTELNSFNETVSSEIRTINDKILSVNQTVSANTNSIEAINETIGTKEDNTQSTVYGYINSTVESVEQKAKEYTDEVYNTLKLTSSAKDVIVNEVVGVGTDIKVNIDNKSIVRDDKNGALSVKSDYVTSYVGEGLKVDENNSSFSIKLSETNESEYLTVSPDGLCLSGVKSAVEGITTLTEKVDNIETVIGGDDSEGSIIDRIDSLEEKADTNIDGIADLAETTETLQAKITVLEGIIEEQQAQIAELLARIDEMIIPTFESSEDIEVEYTDNGVKFNFSKDAVFEAGIDEE